MIGRKWKTREGTIYELHEISINAYHITILLQEKENGGRLSIDAVTWGQYVAEGVLCKLED